MSVEIRSIQHGDLPQLSKFLIAGFKAAPDAEFANPDVLCWKYFDPMGTDDCSRCFVAVDNGQIVACVGISQTRLVVGHPPRLVSTSQGFDWLSSKTDLAAGLMVGQRADQCADIQVAIGGTAKAVKIRARGGYKTGLQVPEFIRILRPSHRLRQPRPVSLGKAVLQMIRDSVRRMTHPPRHPTIAFDLRQVRTFGDEVAEITRQCVMPEIYTVRSPELLNHFLRYPRHNITGWHFMQGNRVRGYALLSVVQHESVRVGKIVDLFFDNMQPDLWQAGLHGLTQQLAKLTADIAVCYATTPWMVNALMASGYFNNRLRPLDYHDPKKLMPPAPSFYLTHLEADHAYF